MSSVTDSTNTKQINSGLNEDGAWEKKTATVGKNLDQAEKEYLKVLADPNSKASDQAEAQIHYQRALRVWEAMGQLMKNAHEILMRGIEKLRLN